MTQDTPSPIRPTDDAARKLARDLLGGAAFCAIGTLDPETGHPHVTRIAIGTTNKGAPVTLISSLSAHTRALQADSRCSLLLGEPGDKGDPLTHPRLTLQAVAHFIRRETPEHDACRTHWLDQHPKSKLYIDFGDFAFARFDVTAGHLNGGFGKAFTLTPADLGL